MGKRWPSMLQAWVPCPVPQGGAASDEFLDLHSQTSTSVSFQNILSTSEVNFISLSTRPQLFPQPLSICPQCLPFHLEGISE